MFYNVFLGVHLTWHEHSKKYILAVPKMMASKKLESLVQMA